MFEQKIEEITAMFSRITIGEQESITARQIANAPIPKSLKLFFERDIDLWVREEKQRLMNSAHFHYKDNVITERINSVVEVLPQYAHFTALEYAKTLERNVSLLFNYVCRPQWSLQRYFFADRENVPTYEIGIGLKYFWHYEYYGLILTEYFSRKSLDVIDSNRFEELLRNIDKEVTKNLDSKKLVQMAEPIFELFKNEDKDDNPLVPLEALLIFFDDKALSSIVEVIEKERSQRELLSMHELVILIGKADFTMNFDIAAIVDQHVRALGVLAPEREAHAGVDFDIPVIPVMEQETDHIQDDNGELNFVITEEEKAVIELDSDSIEQTDDLNTPAEIENPGIEDSTINESIDELIENDEELNLILLSDNDEAGGVDDPNELPVLTMDSIEDTDINQNDFSASAETGDSFKEIKNIDDEEDKVILPEKWDEIAGLGLLDEETVPAAGVALVDDEIDLELILEDSESELAPDELADFTDDTLFNIDWEKESADLDDIMIKEDIEDYESGNSITVSSQQEITAEKSYEQDALLAELDLADPEVDDSMQKEIQTADLPFVDETNYPVHDKTRKEEIDTPPNAIEIIAKFGDLFEKISTSDQKKYAKKLFRKNTDVVRHALEVLNLKPTWREASEYIDELFMKHDVDTYSRNAIQFTDDIYKRYQTGK